MFLPRLDPQTAALIAPATPGSRIGRTSRRTARACAWSVAGVAVPATIALTVLGFVAGAVFWIAALVLGCLAFAFVASTALLLRADVDPSDRIHLAEADRESFERMTELHTAHITGISRSLGRAVGAELEQLLGRIEGRWAALASVRRAAQFEQGRQLADYPRTADQQGRIAALAARCAEAAGKADELLRISRALPGRIAALADNPERRVEPGALRLAMIEAQLRMDDVLAAEPAR